MFRLKRSLLPLLGSKQSLAARRRLPDLNRLGLLGFSACAALAAPLFAHTPIVLKESRLNFIRITQIPADLPANRPPVLLQGDWIVDLRGTHASAKEIETLSAWLHFQTSAERATFVLLNAHTSRAILDCLGNEDWPALLTLAPDTSGIDSDIKVSVADEQDAGAISSIEMGRPLEDLIQPKIKKERLDEASLAREHNYGAASTTSAPAASVASAPGSPAPAEQETPASAAPEAEGKAASSASAKATQAAEPADRLLAKAVQIQKALGIFRERG